MVWPRWSRCARAANEAAVRAARWPRSSTYPSGRLRPSSDTSSHPMGSVAGGLAPACSRAPLPASLPAQVLPAITASSMALCSAPCKALRFAPTPLARGLRALTAPPRSSTNGTYVMAGRVAAPAVVLTLDVGFGAALSCRYLAGATRHPLRGRTPDAEHCRWTPSGFHRESPESHDVLVSIVRATHANFRTAGRARSTAMVHRIAAHVA
jgi:hypothetical protein